MWKNIGMIQFTNGAPLIWPEHDRKAEGHHVNEERTTVITYFSIFYISLKICVCLNFTSILNPGQDHQSTAVCGNWIYISKMETKKNCSTISCMRRNDQQQHHRKTFVVEICVTVVTVTPFSWWVKLTVVKQRHTLLGNNDKGSNASILHKHNELCLKTWINYIPDCFFSRAEDIIVLLQCDNQS